MEDDDHRRRPSSSYYRVLGVRTDSSHEDIRRAYRKPAMRWHPDRWMRSPSSLGEAKRKFQRIQEAYSVLSDQRKRTMYDSGLYGPDDDENEGFSDFLREMMSLMAEARREEKSYSLKELQGMLMELVQGFDSSFEWFSGISILDNNSGTSKRARCETQVFGTVARKEPKMTNNHTYNSYVP